MKKAREYGITSHFVAIIVLKYILVTPLFNEKGFLHGTYRVSKKTQFQG
jgi:hypothetical protein